MKKFSLFFLCSILLLSLSACNSDYKSTLISVMTKQETATVKDIFTFEFDRAYIFDIDDGYTDGEHFTQKYNLDISINQVEYGETDNIQRIVFVDTSGAFVYEFQCNVGQVRFLELGVVIYPETMIQRKSSLEEKPLTIQFVSAERYGS